MDQICLFTGGITFSIYGYSLFLTQTLKDDLKIQKELAARNLNQCQYVDINNNNMACGGWAGNCNQMYEPTAPNIIVNPATQIPVDV